MTPKDPRNFSPAVPLIVGILLMKEAQGAAETTVAVFAVIATVAFVNPAANRVWAPLLRRAGFWRTSLLLGGALSAVGLGAAAISTRLGLSSGMRNILLQSAIAGLLYSWGLAALRAAQDGNEPKSDAAKLPGAGAMWRRFRGPHLRPRG
jgi:hypothetical protein